ncbi:MAG TPA: allantoinase AllB [Mycobacteriales bacterium]|nr:allantoinase AllB [Mycobacteriales bacterium]
MDLLIRARSALLPDGPRECSIGISEGRIVSIGAWSDPDPADRTVELADDEVLLPGLVDSHVHVNEPGRTAWEGFATATAAAAAGGITTLVDMPLNSIPPTCDVDALGQKRAVAARQCSIDVGFWGGAIPGNLAELRALHDAGVFGFKCFLLPSGVEEFPPLDDGGLAAAMREIASFDGLLIVHAEDPGVVRDAPHDRRYESFVDSRPPEAENRSIRRLIEFAADTGCRVHVLHLSSAAALPMIADARARGLPLTVETCPHYLVFEAGAIPDGATQFKCCPPIRDEANRDALWDGLRGGVIDCVVSDHSPCTPDLKQLDTGDFADAWGGIASIQLGLPAVWTEARTRGFALADVVRWMSQRPAELVGLGAKGKLAPGYDADLCVFVPDAEFVVDVAELKHKNPVTPYAGRTLTGVVRSTWLRGVAINDQVGTGRLLSRGEG